MDQKSSASGRALLVYLVKRGGGRKNVPSMKYSRPDCSFAPRRYRLLGLFLVLLAACPAFGQQVFNPDRYDSWQSAGNFSVVPSAAGVTFSQMRRGSGNGFSTAPDGINSLRWQSASAAAAVTDNRHTTFSAIANTVTAFNIDSIAFVLRRNNTGPDSFQLQYKSPATGYAFVPFAARVYTLPTPAVNSVVTVVPASPADIPPNDSIVFRLVAWHGSGQFGSLCVVNGTRIYGSARVPSVTPEIRTPYGITGTPFCVLPGRGDSLRLSFNSIGVFDANNRYTLQLSDASGSFAAPVPLGSLASSSNTGHIAGHIPAGTIPGSYRIRVVSDSPAATGTDTTIVIHPGVRLGAHVTHAVCHNGAGAVDVTMISGTAPYTFAWSSHATTEDLGSSTPGTYGLHITDTNGCPADSSFTILNVDTILISRTLVQPTCAGNANGEITLAATGGWGQFTYHWANSALTGAHVTGLTAGTYPVQVRDSAGCTVSLNLVLQGAAQLVIAPQVTPANCHGAHTGSASVTVSGGRAPYTYLWNNGGGTGSTATGLAAGNYSVTVTDSAGCTGSVSVTVGEPSALALTTSSTESGCQGQATGSASVSVSGGTAPYTYQWNNGGGTASTATGLAAGTYSVTVTDAAGCTRTASVTVSAASPLSLSATSTGAACATCPNGSLALTVLGGTPPYTFLWANGGTGISLSGLVPGTYCVNVSDASGCTAQPCFTVISTAGIDNYDAGTLPLYPNPSDGHTQIRGRLPQNVSATSLRVSDIQGKIRIQQVLNLSDDGSFALDVSTLDSGVYLLLMDSGTATVAKGKIVITR